jgi:peroxiredoxin
MSNRVEINTPAPDFNLADFKGNKIHLSNFRSRKNVLLVFNRGFV